MDFSTIFTAISAKAEAAGTINDNDYIQDGIIYCGNCKTPKQSVIDVPMIGIKTVRCMCKCETEDYNRKIEAEKEVQRRLRIKNMRSRGLHDTSLQNCTFANDNGRNPNMGIAEKYVARWEEMKNNNISLLLHGGVGCGKTYIAACVANALIDRGVPVLMATTAAIIDRALSFDAGYDFLREMDECDLIVIDDFGAERGTEYATQKLFELIDARTKQRKPMIITTNLSAEEMSNTKDLAYQRIFSRLSGACVYFACKGNDMRQAQRGEKLQELLKHFTD